MKSFLRNFWGLLYTVFVFLILGVILLPAVLFLSVCALLVSPKKTYETDSAFYRVLLNIGTAGGLILGHVRLHTSGLDKLPEDKRMLFVGNHLSNFDPLITWFALKKWHISFVSKGANFKIPWFGRFIHRCCFMEIDRENPRKAIVTINRAAELLKRQEVSIGVYPEGTRSKTGELLPFHNGVFKIGQKAASDMAVIALRGSNEIKNNFPFHATDVYLDVLEVIPAEEICSLKTDGISQRVESALRNHITMER